MPIDRTAEKLKSRQQMIVALEPKLSDATYEQIGKSLDPPVQRSRAFKIVQKALDERIHDCKEDAERTRAFEIARLGRLIFGLEKDPQNRANPRAVDTLLRLYESRRKLLGLDAPQRNETTGKDGGPIQTRGDAMNFSKLSLEELLQLEALHKKMAGEAGSTEKPVI